MEIVSREQWGAAPPRSVHQIDTPTPELWLHHSAGALDAGGNGVWWDDVRGIQRFHMAPEPEGRGWSDIAYSFLVGGGQVFEGRGAGIAGGHTKGHNTISHAICLIGNYETMQPTEPDLQAIAALMRHGREKGWWGDLTGDHSAASGANTSCCGRNLRAQIPRLRDLAASKPTPPPTMEADDVFTAISPKGFTWLFEPGHMTLLPPADAKVHKAPKLLGSARCSEILWDRLEDDRVKHAADPD